MGLAPVGAFEALRLLAAGLEVVGAAVEVDDDVAADVEGASLTGSLTVAAGGSRGAAGECWALERVRAIFVRRGVVEANPPSSLFTRHS